MKTIVITGASEGIGKAIALKLAAPDTKLILVARNEAKLAAVSAAAQEKSAEVETFSVDLKDQSSLKAFSDNVQAADVLINNAGVWQKKSVLDGIDDQAINDVFDTNMTSHILLTKHFLPKLRKSDAPKIINIISKAGVTAQDGLSVYTASKWGMKGFTDVLRNDLADDGIRVGAVYQSGTATEMFDKTGEDVPIEKFTDPNDLASVIKFMLDQPDKIWLNEVHVAF